MNTHRTVRTAAAGAVLLTAVAAGASPASASPWPAEDFSIAKFYDNSFSGESDYILMGGPADLAGWCGGEAGTVTRSIRQTPSTMFLRAYGSIAIQLYDAKGMSAPQFLDAACGSGELPEPVGTGTGWVEDRVVVDLSEGTAKNPNSLTGSVLTTDGTRLQVRGYALNRLTGPGEGYPVKVTLTVSANR